MLEQEVGIALIILLVGFVLGIIATLITNKIRSGSAYPAEIKKEMEDYQDKVEAHFDETSNKFKQMASQYQDLYQHLSVGATTLCRPENIAPGLVVGGNPLGTNTLDKKTISKEDADKAMKTAAVAKVQAKIKAETQASSGKNSQVKPEVKSKTSVTDKNSVKTKTTNVENKASTTAPTNKEKNKS